MDGSLQVFFVDNHLLVVGKSAGLPTQASKDHSTSLHLLARRWIEVTYQKPGRAFLEPVHRLDRPVSGLVLFARTSKALSRLQEQLRTQKFQKTYYALVEGKPPLQEAFLENFLIHKEHYAKITSPEDPLAKRALLHYQLLYTKNTQSLLQVELHTGRYHQIRAQLAFLGCPIVGDSKYGAKVQLSPNKIALHHGRVAFTHPVTQEPLLFKAPFPEEYLALLSLSIPEKKALLSFWG